MIYLDHHAATPLCPEAEAAMADARAVGWANPSSMHTAGRRARAWLESARSHIAENLGARAADVVLTGGGTEACNLGVLGLAATLPARIVTTSIEHPGVARAVESLERHGSRVIRIDVHDGIAPDAESLASWIDDEPALLAVQWVNHETGTILPVREWAAACRARGARVFVDATQALGKLALDVTSLDADALALASHKIGGPAGAGALWVRREQGVAPVLYGGEQERGRRPGTPDVVAQAGFGAACGALADRVAAQPALARRRDALEHVLRQRGASINGAGGPRVGTVVDASVPGWEGDVLVAALDVEGICGSSGAACSSGVTGPSAVLQAMYPEHPWRARSALRLSLGPEVDDEHVTEACNVLERVLARGTPK